MNQEIARQCNKPAKQISISDLQRLFTNFHQLSEKIEIKDIDFSTVEQIILKYQLVSPFLDVGSFIYSIACSLKGNPGPILIKLLIKSTNKVSAQYDAMTYLASQCSIILYKENINLDELQEPEPCSIDSFDPIFKLLNQQHIKDIAKLMDLKIDINTPIEEARSIIINELNYNTNNKVKYLINKTIGENKYTYKVLLLTLSSELKIQDVDDISAEEIEKKIVMRFLQETIEKLNDKEKTDLQNKLKSLDDNLINKELLTSSGLMVC